MINGDNVYGAIGSDHTDRDLETDSIPKSKLIYPNIISKEIWFLEDIRGVWDQLLLRSWVIVEKERKPYQEARLSAFLGPDALLNFIKSNVKDKTMDGFLIYSGTVPLLSAQIISGEGFEVELLNPLNQMKRTCGYKTYSMDFLRAQDRLAQV
jgi:hypothetical protein